MTKFCVVWRTRIFQVSIWNWMLFLQLLFRLKIVLQPIDKLNVSKSWWDFYTQAESICAKLCVYNELQHYILIIQILALLVCNQLSNIAPLTFENYDMESSKRPLLSLFFNFPLIWMYFCKSTNVTCQKSFHASNHL